MAHKQVKNTFTISIIEEHIGGPKTVQTSASFCFIFVFLTQILQRKTVRLQGDLNSDCRKRGQVR